MKFVVQFTLLALMPSVAFSQDVDAIGSQLDVNIGRQDDLLEPAEDEDAGFVFYDGQARAAKRFTFSLGAPITHSSNANRKSEAEVEKFHAVPFARLQWAGSAGNLNISALAGTQHDEFIDYSPADLTSLFGRFAVQLGDGKARIAPYGSYSPTIAFTDFYSNHRVTFHDFALGASRKLPLSGGILEADLAYMWRGASTGDASHHRPTGRLKYTAPVTKVTELVLEQVLQPRWYTQGENEGRSDFNSQTKATLNFTPSWLDPVRFGATVLFEWNRSDVADKEYTLLDVGPTISSSWKF